MTDKIALFLAVVVVALLVVDAQIFDWSYSLIAMQRFTQFTEYLAFWR